MQQLIEIQHRLTAKFQGDHSRIARMEHFVGLLKTAIDGLAGLGVVVSVGVEGLEGFSPVVNTDTELNIANAIKQVGYAADR